MKVAKKYKKNDKVVFLGVTSEDASTKKKTYAFLKKTGVKFKVAIGARKTMKGYKIKYLPTTMVVGADGKVLWHNYMNGEGTLEEAIAKALKAVK
ncbi:MAG: TlpA disulfide reductase family protein [Planctomycetota bacterium]|nr:TlpA disulfide reductase family protein [Planctomycetota bacterium]